MTLQLWDRTDTLKYAFCKSLQNSIKTETSLESEYWKTVGNMSVSGKELFKKSLHHSWNVVNSCERIHVMCHKVNHRVAGCQSQLLLVDKPIFEPSVICAWGQRWVMCVKSAITTSQRSKFLLPPLVFTSVYKRFLHFFRVLKIAPNTWNKALKRFLPISVSLFNGHESCAR